MRKLCPKQDWESHRVPNPVSGVTRLEYRGSFSYTHRGSPHPRVGKAEPALTYPHSFDRPSHTQSGITALPEMA